MRNNPTWTLLLILPCVLVSSRPIHDHTADVMDHDTAQVHDYRHRDMSTQEEPDPHDEQVISVRITSSIAVGRGKNQIQENKRQNAVTEGLPITYDTDVTTSTAENDERKEESEVSGQIPAELIGANIEFIKQLHSKKEARGLHNYEKVQSFHNNNKEFSNETNDSVGESSVFEVQRTNDENDDNIENVPLGRSVALSPSSKNYIQGLMHKQLSERRNNPILTTVSFNVHDTPKETSYHETKNTYATQSRPATDPPKIHDTPMFYNEPSKVYSQPAQIYSEPAKIYSEPAKIYSEPAKIYSEPAKIYSEPAKIYSEPAKFYSEPASLHLPPEVAPSRAPWHPNSQGPIVSSTFSTTPITTPALSVIPRTGGAEQQPERNYEVDEKVSVLTDGRSHGIQESNTESCKQENCKVGYVVEGRQYRKYRVEERTSDGFIVGEYGVVRNEDGALRGVRYTADSDASPRLIYDALMKFLQL